MNHQGTFKNRKLLWEELAPSPELRSNAQPNSGGYTSIPTADETATRRPRPRLGFARRTTENLDPVQAPEPLPHFEDELDDFRPSGRRFFWRPRSTTGWAILAIAGVIFFGAATTGAIVLRNQVLRNTRFNLANSTSVQMSGASEVSRADLLPVFSDDVGHNVFAIPLAVRRKQLEQISWVQRATVMRILPNQLRVSVIERTPVAFVRSTPEDPRIGLVDSDGVLLKMPASLVAQRHYSFPVVAGIDAKDSLVERHKRMIVYMRLIHELDSGNSKLSEQISEIDLRDPNDARVLMPEAGADILAHFGSDHFLDRYQTYQSHIGEWRQQYPRLSTVDLRYEQQVVLRQSGDAAAPAVQSTEPALPAHAADSAANIHPVGSKMAESKASESKANESTPPAAPAGPTAHSAKASPSKPLLAASIGPAQVLPVHADATKNSSSSKTDATKSQKPSPKTLKVASVASNSQKDPEKSNQDNTKVTDAPTSVSSTIQPQPAKGRIVETAFPVEKTPSGKAADNSTKASASGGRDKNASAAKNKKPATRSSVNQSKGKSKTSKRNSSSGKRKKNAAKDKSSVKRTSAQVTHTQHPPNQQ